jgi:predicted dehydrogenase
MTPISHAMADSREPNSEAGTRDRVLIAGLGRIGLDYACAFALHPGAEVAGFVEPRSELRRFARTVGFNAPSEATLGRWLEKRPADTLVVCAPAEEAADLVEKGVTAGLAILVHGLAGMPRAAVDRIEKALESCERPVAAGSAVLFQPTFARARRTGALSPHGLQQVRASASVSRVFSPHTQPGHDVVDYLLTDLLLLLDASFGTISHVAASGQRLYGEWLDECQAEAKFANGLSAKIEVSWSVPGYPGAAMVIEGSGAEGRVIVSDDALEMDLASLQGRVVAASEPSIAQSEGGESPAVVAGWLRALTGDVLNAEALSVMRAIRVARVVDAVRHSIAADGIEREVLA